MTGNRFTFTEPDPTVACSGCGRVIIGADGYAVTEFHDDGDGTIWCRACYDDRETEAARRAYEKHLKNLSVAMDVASGKGVER